MACSSVFIFFLPAPLKGKKKEIEKERKKNHSMRPLHAHLPCSLLSVNGPGGRVVKTSVSSVGGSGSNRDWVKALINNRTGGSGVSLLWMIEIASFICNFILMYGGTRHFLNQSVPLINFACRWNVQQTTTKSLRHPLIDRTNAAVLLRAQLLSQSFFSREVLSGHVTHLGHLGAPCPGVGGQQSRVQCHRKHYCQWVYVVFE